MLASVVFGAKLVTGALGVTSAELLGEGADVGEETDGLGATTAPELLVVD